jgi:hypothetical protein
MSAEFMLQLAGMVGAAAGVYGAIRADLAALRVTAQNAQEAAQLAHRRIDALIQ